MHICIFAWVHGVQISQKYQIKNYIKYVCTSSINLYRIMFLICTHKNWWEKCISVM